MKKCSVIHEEVINVFHDNFCIPTLEKCHFIFFVLEFLIQWNTGRLEIIFQYGVSKMRLNLKLDHKEKFIKSMEIKS